MSVRKDSYTWLGVGTLVAIIACSAVFFILSYQKSTTVRVGDGVFRVRIASTDAQREKGLGGVTQLAQNEAMLLAYDASDVHKIWMKDMKISIDAVWLNADRRVVYIEQSISPESYPTAYGPSSPTKYVLELSDGAIQRARIKLGMQAIFDDQEKIE